MKTFLAITDKSSYNSRGNSISTDTLNVSTANIGSKFVWVCNANIFEETIVRRNVLKTY